MHKLTFYTKLFLDFALVFGFIGFCFRISIPFNLDDLSTYPDIIYYNEFIASFPQYSMNHYWNGIQFFGVIYLPHFYFVFYPMTYFSISVQLNILGIIILVLVCIAIIRISNMNIHFLSKVFVQTMLCYHLLKGIYYCNMELIVLSIVIIILTEEKINYCNCFMLALFSFKIITLFMIVMLLWNRHEIKKIIPILFMIFILNFWYLIVIKFDFQYVSYVFTHGFDTTLPSADILTLLSRPSMYLPLSVLEIEISYKIYEGSKNAIRNTKRSR